VYDFVVVGCGFFGAVFAYEVKKAGKKVLVIENEIISAAIVFPTIIREPVSTFTDMGLIFFTHLPKKFGSI